MIAHFESAKSMLRMVAEIQSTDHDVKKYIFEQMANLLINRDFDYVVQGSTKSDKERENLIFQRIEAVVDNV